MKVVDLGKAAVNADVVTALEQWLAHARSGKLQALALVGISADGSSATRTAGTDAPHGPVSRHALVGGLGHLQYRMNKTLDEDVE